MQPSPPVQRLTAMRLRKLSPLVLALSAALAVSCGAVSVSASAPKPVAAAVAATGASSPGTTPSQRAAADAKAILAQFRPPPGAVKLDKQPALPSGSASMVLDSATQAQAVSYWRASGSAPALQAWERGHISRSFTGQDVIVGPPDWNTVYSLPPVVGVLPVREMNVQFYSSGGATVIMADAMVSWQPLRPASEVIPGSVTTVTVAEDGGWRVSHAPVAITSLPEVRRLAALINALPLSTAPSRGPCSGGGSQFTMTFRTVASGPGVALIERAACGALSFDLNGKDQPALQPSGSYVAAVLGITGLNWEPI
jgi:hypothetical protein